MKPILQPRNEASVSPNPSSVKQLQKWPTPPLPNSSGSSRKQRVPKENAPPPDPYSSPSAAMKHKSPLPPRPPNSNPLKRKLIIEPTGSETAVSGSSDSGVKVIVRMRPPTNGEEDGDMTVQKISSNCVSITGHTFTFDSVADTQSTQLDIFQLVGAPLVENCLAGFNSSVFAYGQTGSGKTYTIWGPANALLEDNLSSDQQGLTPRVFQHLFTRIEQEQIKHADEELKYQCRCSFLEIYNEQITDLLDPNQRNLQIREDVKTGVYVENLTEECVSTMKDVKHLLLKGLSNRRTGATSINAESSRSHSVFTCVVESRCKSMADGLSCRKTSRINLVDLAGSERQKLTGAAGERLKEAGNINRSLSQLGNLINILAEVSQTGKPRHIPYRDSKLTFLLQESLGGNAKLAMICAISPSQSCKNETFSTLRFAQRAKAIKNKAVVNEEMQDDVNFLRQVIRQLKEELIQMKTNQKDQNGNYSTGWNARRSLNLLKFSLNRSLAVPFVDDDGDTLMEIVEEAERLDLQSNAFNVETGAACTEEIAHEDMDEEPTPEKSPNCSSNLSIVPCDIPKSPTQSVSPRVVNTGSRKSLRTSSMLTASEKNLIENELDASNSSLTKPSNSTCLNTQSTRSRNCFKSTEHLAASLHRGLEIVSAHRQSAALRKSSFRFSYKPAEIRAIVPVTKVDVGVQTVLNDNESFQEGSLYLCSKCKTKNSLQEPKDASDSLNLQLVPVDGSQSCDKFKVQVPKAVEKVLAGAIRREMALEEICSKQSSEIMQLNRLIQQYKHERECNAVISQTREDKIARLESLMDGVLITEDFMEDEMLSLTHEHKILKEKYENHPELLSTKIELRQVQDELERYRNFFDLGEREVLLEEIQDLRSQLQFYVESSPKASKKQSPLLQLTYSCQQSVGTPLSAIPEPVEDSAEHRSLSAIPESTEDSAEQILERERLQWTETESKWISLVEELRSELEASRALAQKQKIELEMEKKCSEELKEAMQIAMQGHARMLEQYADLEEKHMQLLARHRKIQDGIEDVKKAAAKAGVRGAESRFINALAAEISALKVEREKERRYFIDENKGLQAQLRDTAEAVEAAGELLVRLKEADEAVQVAEKRATGAEQEASKAYKQIEKLKKKHEYEINSLKQLLEESRVHKEKEAVYDSVEACSAGKYDAATQTQSSGDQRWREEFESLYQTEEELAKLEPTSWFSGYDRCNI
ncbi:PREDICTED: kinesin-like protein KIN-12B isoform X1 [Ipomoea nil]|uniref:kinesin-like protein KIN-12B isoform X1 n=2 Tax=Ipomoea nil TaxID=35883 RepID=UPI0009012312|nr:PREDICTED: kinesin-like protein KIN-12B isoform X1 [Ipomoea nil]